MTIEINDIT